LIVGGLGVCVGWWCVGGLRFVCGCVFVVVGWLVESGWCCGVVFVGLFWVLVLLSYFLWWVIFEFYCLMLFCLGVGVS